MQESTAVSDVQPRWFAPSDVARWCGVAQRTINRWCDRENGPPHQVTPSGIRRFREDLIKAWLLDNGFVLPAELQ